MLIINEHMRSIHTKSSPADPNFLCISIACISFDPADTCSCIVHTDAETDRWMTDKERSLEICKWMAAGSALSASRSLSLCLC